MLPPLRLLVLLLLCPVASAQQLQTELQGLEAPPPPPGAGIDYNFHVGSQVAVTEHWLAVADPGADTVGEVYLFERTSAGWVLQQTIKSPADWGAFGRTVAMDGATLVIADSLWSGYFGRVYIYDLRENGWERSQVIDGDGLLPDDKPYFGERLAISGEVLAVGAMGVDVPTMNAGELRIYERRTDGWELARRFRLPAIHEVIRREYFGYGYGISIHGDTVVSSAPAGFEGGVVFVHERIAGVWRRTAKIDSPSTDVGASFGVATAIWGDTLVVGRPHESFHAAIGRAYVYERSSLGEWALMQSLRASDAFVDGDSGDRFGGSLALMEDRLVVGANNAWTQGYHTGTAYLFERNLDGTWSQTENRRLAQLPQFAESPGHFRGLIPVL